MLDNRMSRIAKKILESPYVIRQDLMEQLSLTKRQVDYSLEKINDWLSSQKIPPIILSNQEVQVADKTRTFLATSLAGSDAYYLSATERQLYIFLMLITEKEFLSMNHFLDVLSVGKSSFVKDVRELEQDLEKYHIKLLYSRQKGYHLAGGEGDLRGYLIRQMMMTLTVENNPKILDMFTRENRGLRNYEQTRATVVTQLEKQGLNFAANRLREFIYSFVFMEKRLSIYPDYAPEINQLSIARETLEYQLARDLINVFELPTSTVNYLSVWLLGMTEINLDYIGIDHAIGLEMVEDLLIRFEYLSGNSFENRDLVLKQIYQHVRPAHYRLLFNIPIVNPLLNRIKKEYDELFVIVKESLKHYEESFDLVVPEDEVAFLVIHFASLMQKYQSKTSKKIIAAVTCPNGIGSSMILYAELKAMFPDFDFLPPITHMDLKLLFSKVDFIFSTTGYHDFLPADKSFFVVNSVMSAMEKRRLEKDVYTMIGRSSYKAPDFSQVMNVIEKYVDGKTKKTIEKALRQEVFGNKDESDTTGRLKHALSDLIDPAFIQLKVEVADRIEATYFAAKPLLEAEVITQAYVQKLQDMVGNGAEYFVIAKHVAMPHGKVCDGTLKLGMGITTLENPVRFGNDRNDPVKYIFTLSAIDKTSHLLALSTLVLLLAEPDFYEVLDQGSSGVEVLDFIREFEENQ